MATTDKTIRLKPRLEEVLSDSSVKALLASLLPESLTFTCDRVGEYEGTIGAGVSDEALSLHGITTVKLVAIYAAGPVTVKLNGEAVGHLVDSIHIHTGDVSGVTISNAGVAAVDLAAVVAGDVA